MTEEQEKLFDRLKYYKNIVELKSDHFDDSLYTSSVYLSDFIDRLVVELKKLFGGLEDCNSWAKSCRWIGYIQGILIDKGLLDMNTERDITREFLPELDKYF